MNLDLFCLFQYLIRYVVPYFANSLQKNCLSFHLFIFVAFNLHYFHPVMMKINFSFNNKFCIRKSDKMRCFTFNWCLLHYFNCRANLLDHVMYRMGVLAVLRSKLKKGNSASKLKSYLWWSEKHHITVENLFYLCFLFSMLIYLKDFMWQNL